MTNWTELQKAADTAGIAATPIGLRTLDDLEPGLEQAVRGGVNAVMITTPGTIPAAFAYARLADLAQRHHLPSMGFERRFAEPVASCSKAPTCWQLPACRLLRRRT